MPRVLCWGSGTQEGLGYNAVFAHPLIDPEWIPAPPALSSLVTLRKGCSSSMYREIVSLLRKRAIMSLHQTHRKAQWRLPPKPNLKWRNHLADFSFSSILWYNNATFIQHVFKQHFLIKSPYVLRFSWFFSWIAVDRVLPPCCSFPNNQVLSSALMG